MIVVGSGPAGAAAAVFLSRAGVDVLVLEAGSERSSLGLTVRVRGLTVLKYSRPLKWREGVTATDDPTAALAEAIAPGGLSNHWSCAVPRFAPEDFDDARRAGESCTWPIGYEDVAPWYGRVEPMLHVAGPNQGSAQLPAGDVRHARQLGSDWGPLVDEARRIGRTLTAMPYAYGADTTLTLSGTPFNAFVRLVRPELRAGRLAVRYDARVARLEWSRERRRVEAVVIRDTRTGGEERVECRAVVLAAGAIGTAELLFASSSAEFPDGLGNTHGVLGRYLHDHPLAKLVLDLGRPISVRASAYLTRPSLDRSPALYAAACMQWGGTAALARSLLTRKPGRRSWVGFSVFGAMVPTIDSWVAPDPARRSADGVAGLELHLRHPREAREALDSARDDLVGALERTNWAPQVRVWNVEPPGNSVHYGGTCRMHASPRFGMVDHFCRLHAVRNVAVADSSVFTTGPEKNPVLTSMALAARAGHQLAEELKAGDI